MTQPSSYTIHIDDIPPELLRNYMLRCLSNRSLKRVKYIQPFERVLQASPSFAQLNRFSKGLKTIQRFPWHSTETHITNAIFKRCFENGLIEILFSTTPSISTIHNRKDFSISCQLTWQEIQTEYSLLPRDIKHPTAPSSSTSPKKKSWSLGKLQITEIDNGIYEIRDTHIGYTLTTLELPNLFKTHPPISGQGAITTYSITDARRTKESLFLLILASVSTNPTCHYTMISFPIPAGPQESIPIDKDDDADTQPMSPPSTSESE